MDVAKQLVHDLFESIGEDETHGYGHALKVLAHAEAGLNDYLERKKLHIDQQMAVRYAALLHDVDDTKIFPKSSDYENARKILEQIKFNLVDDVLDMISLVSFSVNGISTVYSSTSPFLGRRSSSIHGSQLSAKVCTGNGTKHRIPKWKLIPRDADRLEALGKIGVARCVAYGVQAQRSLFLDQTPRVTTTNQLLQLATQTWLTKHFPNSTLDYFMAGLVPRSFMSSDLSYFIHLAAERTQPIIQVCLIFGHHGNLTKEDLLSVVAGDESAEGLIQKYL